MSLCGLIVNILYLINQESFVHHFYYLIFWLKRCQYVFVLENIICFDVALVFVSPPHFEFYAVLLCLLYVDGQLYGKYIWSCHFLIVGQLYGKYIWTPWFWNRLKWYLIQIGLQILCSLALVCVVVLCRCVRTVKLNISSEQLQENNM